MIHVFIYKVAHIYIAVKASYLQFMFAAFSICITEGKMHAATLLFLHFAQIFLAQNFIAAEKNGEFCAAGDSCHSPKQNQSATDSTADYYAEMLRTTPILGGGFALIWLGSVAGLFYSLWSWVIYFIRREALLSMEVSCREECYSW